MIGSQFTMAPKTVVPGAKIYYTLNGRDPLDTDLPYDSPVTLNIPAGEKRIFKTVVITPSGRRSLPTSAVLYNQTPVAAANYTGNTPGLKFTLIKGTFSSVDQLDYAPVDSSGVAKDFATTAFRTTRPNAGVVYEGYISLPADGVYNFYAGNYNDTQLFIDDNKIAENQGALSLLKGYHKIKVKNYYTAPPANARRRGAPPVIQISMITPGTTDKKAVTPEILFN